MKKVVSISLNSELYDLLKNMSHQTRASISGLIELALEKQYNGSDQVVEKKKKPKKDDGPKTTEIREAYIRSFKERYGTAPVWAAKENKLAQNLLKSIGLEKAIEVSGKYPFYNDPWHIGQKHSFSILISQLNKVLVELNDPRRMLDSLRAKKEIDKAEVKMSFYEERAMLEKKAKESRAIFDEYKKKHPKLNDYEIQKIFDNQGRLE